VGEIGNHGVDHLKPVFPCCAESTPCCRERGGTKLIIESRAVLALAIATGALLQVHQ
jgi:hypothetical protein